MQGCALCFFSALTAFKVLDLIFRALEASQNAAWMLFALSAVLLLLTACAGFLMPRAGTEKTYRLLIPVLLCGLLSFNIFSLTGFLQFALMAGCTMFLPACLLILRDFCRKAGSRFIFAGLFIGTVFGAMRPEPMLNKMVYLPQITVPHPGLKSEKDTAPSDLSVYNALMTACAEFGGTDTRAIRLIDTKKEPVSLSQLARKVQGAPGDSSAAAAGKPSDFPISSLFPTLQEEVRQRLEVIKNKAPERPQAVLIAEGAPENYQEHFWYTEEAFRQIRYMLEPHSVLAVLLPESFTKEKRLAVCAALKRVFQKVILMHTPDAVLLASDKTKLTTDPDELNDRAQANDLYRKFYAPEHLLALMLPLYQAPEGEDAAFLKEAESASPCRVNSPRFMILSSGRWERPGLLAIPIGLVLLYLILRYAFGWKPERKRRFRMFEAGLYFTGVVFYSCLLQFYAPDQSLFEDFSRLGVFSFLLGTLFSRNVKGLIFSRILFQAVLIAASVANMPHIEQVIIILLSAAAGFSIRYELIRADAPAPDQNSYAMFFAGGGAAALLFPPLFLFSGGIYLTAGLLLLLLAMRLRS